MNVKNKGSWIILPLAFLTACATSSPDSKTEISANQASDQVLESESTQVASSEGTSSNKNRRVCRQIQPTGTRIAKKICKSQGAWDEIARTAHDRLDKMTKPQTNNPQGN